MIEFKLLNQQGLADFIVSSEFKTMPVLPISSQRANSHLANPRMDPDDILLILAYRGNELAGYAGILPDYAFSATEKKIKCGWLSCLWVSEKARGENLGRQLMQKALEHWGDNILSTEFVPFTKKIYDQTGAFSEVKPKSGIRLYLRMDTATLLPPKNKIFRKSKGLLKIWDGVSNLILDRRFSFRKKSKPNYIAENFVQLDTESAKFIAAFSVQEIFRRNSEDLQWILNHPWIINSPEAENEGTKYYFSSFEKSFGFKPFKIRNSKNELVAVLLFSKRNQILKLPYCYVHPDATPETAAFILEKIRDWKISLFTTFHPGLTSFLLNAKTGALKKKKMLRPYLISKKVLNEISWQPGKVQDGDGDCAFT